MASEDCWKCVGTGEHYQCLEYGCAVYDENDEYIGDNCFIVDCDCE